MSKAKSSATQPPEVEGKISRDGESLLLELGEGLPVVRLPIKELIAALEHSHPGYLGFPDEPGRPRFNIVRDGENPERVAYEREFSAELFAKITFLRQKGLSNDQIPRFLGKGWRGERIARWWSWASDERRFSKNDLDRAQEALEAGDKSTVKRAPHYLSDTDKQRQLEGNYPLGIPTRNEDRISWEITEPPDGWDYGSVPVSLQKISGLLAGGTRPDEIAREWHLDLKDLECFLEINKPYLDALGWK